MPALLPPNTVAILFADHFQQHQSPLVPLRSQVASQTPFHAALEELFHSYATGRGARTGYICILIG